MKRLHRIALSLCLSLLLCVTCSSLFSVKVSAATSEPVPFAVEVHSYDEDSNIHYGSSAVQIDTSLSTTPTLIFDIVIPRSALSGFSNGFYDFMFVLHKSVEGSGTNINGTIKFYDYQNQELGSRQFSVGNPINGSVTTYVNSSSYVQDSSRIGRVNVKIYWPEQASAYSETMLMTVSRVGTSSDGSFSSVVAAINDQTGQIKDKIDEVLTPEGENNLGEAVDDITDQVQENLGALGFAHDTVENFINLFNEEPPAPIINVPPLKMKIKGVEHQFFNGYQYDFRSMEDNGLSVLVGAVRTAGTLVLWWAFLQYCLKEFDGFFRR